jgi:hypothetical protein
VSPGRGGGGAGGVNHQFAAKASAAERDDATVATFASQQSANSAHSARSSSTAGSSATGSTTRRAKQFSPEWLLQRVDELAAAKHARLEIARLLTSCRAAEKERNELQAEQAQLQRQEKEGAGQLIKQLRELERRIEKLVQVNKAHRAELAACDAAGPTSHMRQELHAKAAASEKTLRAHLEHRAELEQRLAHGALSSDTLARLQDINDELETLDTELSLNEVRLAEEKRRISKAGLGSRGTLKSSGGKRVDGGDADVAINTLLYQEMEQLATNSTGRPFSDYDRTAFVALAQLGQAFVDIKYR